MSKREFSVRLNNSKRRLLAEALEDRRVLAAMADVSLWDAADASNSDGKTSYLRAIDYELFSLDHDQLLQQLSNAPLEFSVSADQQPQISIPRPDGQLDTFSFVASPIMAPELAAEFPEIQTFLGQDVNNPAARVRFDITPAGFHAQVLSPEGSYYVDPYYHLSNELYASYFASGDFDVSGLGDIQLHDDVAHGSEHESEGSSDSGIASRGEYTFEAARSGRQLRTYRLAVSATGEYTAFHGGNVPSAQAAIVTAINRVTGIYESELAIRLQLVANNSSVIYVDAATDPFTNNNAGLLLSENQAILDSRIGTANYDVGHVFSTGAGGLAALRSVGIPGIKAQGATGLPSPTGDVFYVDYVSHELGHQFGGNHTFNGSGGSCLTNRNAGTAMEPGSGSTIQGYAGICGGDNLQANSDPYFHSVSFDEILAHVDLGIPGVGTRSNTGNAIPSVSAGPSYTIPAGTPFVLTASGSDADANDVLTYSWEQRDLGPQQAVNGGDNGSSPIFRVQNPTTEPTRYFPKLSDLTAGTSSIGETLPTTNRTLNFRVTVRDNHVGAGGVNSADTQIRVIDTGIPFRVTSPNAATTWDGLSQQTITWNVGGTIAAPISTSSVTVRLSTDGGLTYPFLVAQGLPNIGTASIVVPNVATTRGRIMIQGENNVFFDINDQNLIIVEAPITFSSGNSTATYVENSAPVAVATAATVSNPSLIPLNRLPINVTIGSGAAAGDQLSIRSTGTGAGQLSVSGNNILYENVVVATYAGPGTSLNINLTALATNQALETLIRSVSFSNTGDNPGATPRAIRFVFGGAQSFVTTVNVTPTNDSPTVSNTTLPAINEDTTNPAGARISDLLATAFSDVDSGSSLKGIAIVNNTENAADGVWQFSTAGNTNWRPVGNVNSLATSLVLPATGWLRFLPAPNYFGTPATLRIRALDDTYSNAFSSAVSGTRVPLDPVHLAVNGAASSNVATISASIINVNDPPFVNTPQININLLQDEPIDRVFDESIFGDIDSMPLAWTLRSAGGGSLPQWLSFDAPARRVSGTPLNRDVGDYRLVMRATDQEGLFAESSVAITVTNVNDPPEALRLTNSQVDENVSNQVVGQLFGTDPDIGDSIQWTVSDPRFFVRDSLLFISTPIDFEVEQQVPLIITATDSGIPSRSTNLPVNLQINDVNEFFPEFIGEIIAVRNGTPAGSLLRTVNAPDGDLFQSVKYRLKEGDTQAFTINQQTGELRLKNAADLSDKANYNVFVEAFDNGTPIKTRVAQYNVNVTPVNDFPPVVPSPQQFTISEAAPVGSLIGTVAASDADGNALSFSLGTTNASPSWFELDAQTGQLKVGANAAFDFEAGVSYFVDVNVSDGVAPIHTVTTRVNIVLTDANDPPTALTAKNPNVPAQRLGVSVGDLIVSDQDAVSSYSFSTSDPRFEIRAGKLALRTNQFFTDNQAGTSTTVMVTATDTTDSSIFRSLPVQLNVIANAPWQNLVNRFDTSGDGLVSAIDVSLVITALNQPGGARPLPIPRTFAQLSEPDVDVNGDNALSAVDVLLVVNFINAQPEGEASAVAVAEIRPSDATLEEQQWLAAFSALEQEEARRRRR